jgi:hypothetical protein
MFIAFGSDLHASRLYCSVYRQLVVGDVFLLEGMKVRA